MMVYYTILVCKNTSAWVQEKKSYAYPSRVLHSSTYKHIVYIVKPVRVYSPVYSPVYHCGSTNSSASYRTQSRFIILGHVLLHYVTCVALYIFLLFFHPRIIKKRKLIGVNSYTARRGKLTPPNLPETCFLPSIPYKFPSHR